MTVSLTKIHPRQPSHCFDSCRNQIYGKSKKVRRSGYNLAGLNLCFWDPDFWKNPEMDQLSRHKNLILTVQNNAPVSEKPSNFSLDENIFRLKYHTIIYAKK